jgi:hypothetical protein
MEEIEKRYGIRHNAGAIVAISEFLDGVVPEEFTEIDESHYENFLLILDQHPYATYNSETNNLEFDTGQELEADRQRNIGLLREKLRSVSAELDLAVRMQEEPGELQGQFDQLRIEYNDLRGGGE